MPLWQRYRRVPGEPSTFKEPPGSAMESESGICRKGGMHLWRYGRCCKCGRSEGSEIAGAHHEARVNSPQMIYNDPKWYGMGVDKRVTSEMLDAMLPDDH